MKLIIEPIGLGLISAQNKEIALVGGMRSGGSPGGLTRRQYMIYDLIKWEELSKQDLPKSEIEKNSEVGMVELNIKDGEELNFGVHGLRNIEINVKDRKKGVAKRVIKAILHTTGDELKIHDIKKHRASVWRKLGVEKFHDRNGKELRVSKISAHTYLEGTIPNVNRENKLKNEDSSFSL